MQLSLKNAITLIGYLVAVEMAIGTGQLKVTANMLPASWLPVIQDWSAALAILGGMAIGVISRSIPDGSAPAASPVLPPAVKALLLAFGVGLLISIGGGSAFAQASLKSPQQMFADLQTQIGKLQASLPPLKTPDQVVADIQGQVAQFEKVTIADFEAGQKIYVAANNINGINCNGQLLKLAQANAAVTAATNPDGTAAAPSSPGLIAVVAKAYNLHVAFQPGSPTRAQCAAMKDDVLNSTSPLLNAAGLTKLLPFFGMLGL